MSEEEFTVKRCDERFWDAVGIRNTMWYDEVRCFS